MKKQIGLLCAFLVLAVFGGVMQVEAKPAKADVYESYQKEMASIYQKFASQSYLDVALRYAYADLNGDGTNEMLVFDTGNPWSKGAIYSYRGGKVSCAYTDFSLYIDGDRRMQNIDLAYYPSAKLIRCAWIEEAEADYYACQWKGGKYIIISEKHYDEIEQKTSYYVNGKKTTQKKYQAFLEKKTKKAKKKRASKLKWHEWNV